MSITTEEIYGIAGRIDKVDLLFHVEFDQMQVHDRFLRGLADSIQDDTGRYIGFRVKCFGAEKESGKRIYGVSTWGPGADDFLQLLPPEYHTHICRVDFRIEAEITASNLSTVKSRVEEFNPRKRNIREYTTRKRNKEFGRDAGGVGLAFGSHKSDVRLTMYKRSGESGAIEIQLSGKRLANIIHNMLLPNHGEFMPSFYAELATQIIQYIPVLSKEMGYTEFSQLLSTLETSEYTLSYAELIERKMIEARASWEALPEAEQLGFLKELQTLTISRYALDVK